MQTMPLNEVAQDLLSVMNKVNNNHEPLVVTYESQKSVVIMSLDDFNTWQKTVYFTHSNTRDLRKKGGEIRTSTLQLSQFQDLQWFTDIQMTLAPENSPPFDVEAFVNEQDTALVLGQSREITKPVEDTEKLIHQALEMQPLIPGHLLVMGNFPIQLQAIIHDLDQEPSWREEWIEQALHHILQVSEQRHLHSIGMPLLGTVHGSLSTHRSLTLLRSVMEQTSMTYLKRLWLITPIFQTQNPSQIEVTYH